MTQEAFELLITDALSGLPKEFQEVLDNVDVVIEDNPTPQQRRKMRLRPYTHLLGLYEGLPKTNRRNYSMVLPDKITLFKEQIESLYGGEEDAIKEQVRRTVLHEIGHHLGMDDKTLRRLRY